MTTVPLIIVTKKDISILCLTQTWEEEKAKEISLHFCLSTDLERLG